MSWWSRLGCGKATPAALERLCDWCSTYTATCRGTETKCCATCCSVHHVSRGETFCDRRSPKPQPGQEGGQGEEDDKVLP